MVRHSRVFAAVPIYVRECTSECRNRPGTRRVRPFASKGSAIDRGGQAAVSSRDVQPRESSELQYSEQNCFHSELRQHFERARLPAGPTRGEARILERSSSIVPSWDAGLPVNAAD